MKSDDTFVEFPESGLLVPEEVLQIAGTSREAVWSALEQSAVPLAIEYFPVTDKAINKYRSVPINSAAQQALVEVLNATRPNGPTFYRAILPKGAKLAKAAGGVGYRGVSTSSGKITSHAVLVKVTAGGALAASWPVFAVAGTVMAVDMLAQREMRAHQRRVESLLDKQEERHYLERIKDQRSADAQLTRAISLMLDGRDPSMELALKSAYDEFHRSQLFLERNRRFVESLLEPDGKLNYLRLEEGLGGGNHVYEHFFRELHLARAAIAIRRKALLADAASMALSDPANPYDALRRFLTKQADELEQAEADEVALTQHLVDIKLKGGWSIPKAVVKQDLIRHRAAAGPAPEPHELLFMKTASGEIVQLIEKSDDDASQEGPDSNDGDSNTTALVSGDESPE